MTITKIFAAILSVAMLLTLMPVTALAKDTVKDVGTVAELRAALENDAGAHVRLTKDIIFTKANATNKNVGVFLGNGITGGGLIVKNSFVNKGTFTYEGGLKVLVVRSPSSGILKAHMQR